jgi:CDP-paratose 2-epimerase
VSVIVVSGAGGLIGSATVEHFVARGHVVAGIDNDMRRVFFGDESSTAGNVERLRQVHGASYEHHHLDIRDRDGIDALFAHYGSAIAAVIHTAAQPSHDWAARDPFVDFDVNAGGTLAMLEATRAHAADAPFVFCSTNKVYGDTPNRLPLEEHATRFEIDPAHTYAGGIREDMSIDHTLHSLFGASKTSADLLVQEYGRYFSMPTACFRGGTLTGGHHAAAELHGFLAYLMRCTATGRPYRVFGYQGKQVRDAIHADDVVRAFEAFVDRPTAGAVYNIGGGRYANCSVLEAIDLCERIAERPLDWSYVDTNRIGDHVWWVGSNDALMADYPDWRPTMTIEEILVEIHDANIEQWERERSELEAAG